MGWTFQQVGELDFYEFADLSAYWAKNPPAHIHLRNLSAMVAAWLGIESGDSGGAAAQPAAWREDAEFLAEQEKIDKAFAGFASGADKEKWRKMT